MKTKAFIGNIAIAFLSALVAVIVYSNYFHNKLSNQALNEIQTQKAINQYEDTNQVNYTEIPQVQIGEAIDFTAAAEKSINAVVHVTSKYNLQNEDNYSNSILDLFLGEVKRQPMVSFGSGVIISGDGFIVTNYHVVEKSSEIQIVLNDKRSYPAKLVGRDPGTDLAVLKVEAIDLPFINMGNSDVLKVGEWVLAVGNPFNLTSTVTAGIVSAKARNINILSDRGKYTIESYIQTDAAVNKGNSGGALVNLKGELVGINSAIISPSGTYSGYSFAIPINLVSKVVDDIINYGEVQRAVMGVGIGNVNSEKAKNLGLDKIEGVLISSVTEGKAAEEAGIEVNDVILEVNNIKVNSTAELTEQIGNHRPGEIVSLLINRDNKKKQIQVLLRNTEGTTEIVNTSVLGASFEVITDKDKRVFGIRKGLKIVGLSEGALKKAGIKKGYIITKIENERVSQVEDIKYKISNIRKGSVVEIEAMNDANGYIYVYRYKVKVD